MIPSLGRVVHYVLNDGDATSINKRRTDAGASGIARENTGAVVHHGNVVRGGDECPAIIVRIFGDYPSEITVVNLQVFLDGNDIYWATSRMQGTSPGGWHEPERVA